MTAAEVPDKLFNIVYLTVSRRPTAMDYVYVPIGMFVVAIALFKPALLAKERSLRLIRRVFLHKTKHEPRDTYLNWSSGLAADRVFNIVFFGGSFLIFMLTTIGMIKLSKAGW
jgi:hypothetical protein